jgi:hypothetical protein
MNKEESETGTLEKHYRVTLDFKMLIREITPEVCQESFYLGDKYKGEGKDEGEDEAELTERIDRQKRLYRLLREDKQAMEQYLLSVLTQDAARYAYDRLTNAFKVKDEEEVLIPIYQRMAKEDVEFYEGCRKVGALEPNVELISAAFKVEWTGAEIVELKSMLEGDPQRAEVIEETTISLIKNFNSTR